MAGIGFELKRLLAGNGILRKMRAYAYATMVCSGTMLLAIVLLIGVQALAKWCGASERDTSIMVVLLVYALLFSMLLTSGMVMLLSRYVADMLYQKRLDRILPSLYGVTTLLMAIGGLAYGIFLMFSPGIAWVDRLLSWLLFMLLILVWLQMAYITAVKDYKRILLGFALGVAVALVCGYVLLKLGLSVPTALLIAVFLGYCIMGVCFADVLHAYFPMGKGSMFHFIGWAGRYPELLLCGTLNMAGAFVHLMIMWHSPLGECVEGLFYQASSHDVAAFYAYLITLPTTINFVMSVETNFYTRYQAYFDAITGGGTLSEIELKRNEMSVVLNQELFQMAQVQVFSLVAYIALVAPYLESTMFTKQMTTMFQLMSVGYSAYAIGNSVMLMQLYFDDRRDALITAAVFFFANFIGTWLLKDGSQAFYGMGLLAAGCLMYAVGLWLLLHYVKNVDYHVFCGQPVTLTRYKSRLERLADRLDARARNRYEEAT